MTRVLATPPALAALENHDAFIARHIGPRDEAEQAMLRELGFASRDALIDAIVPPGIRADAPLPLPGAIGEAAALARLRAIAAR
ncbi:MAG TPA: hypothetical protein VFI50_08020, partial [Casimicrobiaceae bacterium]|nr:hypothetical protein [Casimicrobiaceae bacterium]